MTSSRYLRRCGSASALASASLDALEQVGDVVAQRDDALARRRLADEVGDQQAQQQLALDRREVHGRAPPTRAAPSRPLSVSV